jgi:RNA polymerase sigma-70 factor (ECF subfamily)
MTVSAEIETLITRVAMKNRRAFARLYDATSGKVFGVICMVLKDQECAQKALQDTYVKIWRTAGRYPSSGLGPMTWIVTHARNIAVDRLQRMPRGFDRVSDDLLDQIYWCGDKYDVLAELHGVSEDEMRGRVADDWAKLQGQLAP